MSSQPVMPQGHHLRQAKCNDAFVPVTLEQCFAAGRRFSVREAAEIAVQVIVCMERYHSAGHPHKAIEPRNIVKVRHKRWVLVNPRFTSRGSSTVPNTFAHTAPELLKGESASIASDIYSVASVFATIITGEEPFAIKPGSTLSERAEILARPYPELRRHGVPDQLATILECSLSKNPAVRPKSGYDLAKQIVLFQTNAGSQDSFGQKFRNTSSNELLSSPLNFEDFVVKGQLPRPPQPEIQKSHKKLLVAASLAVVVLAVTVLSGTAEGLLDGVTTALDTFVNDLEETGGI